MKPPKNIFVAIVNDVEYLFTGVPADDLLVGWDNAAVFTASPRWKDVTPVKPMPGQEEFDLGLDTPVAD